MAPLPPNPYPPLPIEPQSLWHLAYSQCLSFEQNCIHSDNVFLARTLGYLILKAPSDDGRSVVTREILSVPQGAYNKLAELAEYWIQRLIRCFKSAKGRTPAPSSHPSRPFFDGSQRMLDDLLQQRPGSGTAKQKALVCDYYRCVLTGATDATSYDNIPGLAHRRNNSAAYTQLAHIIPESLNEILDNPKKHEWTTSVWTVLDRFAGFDVKQELNGVDIHNLSNVMTLSSHIHLAFDDLSIWLEATGQPNEYRVCAKNTLLIEQCPPTITFTTTDPINYPVPSPRYLAIHAATALVSHLSGAGEYIDKVDRERELSTVLASDGGSTSLLEHLLSSVLLSQTAWSPSTRTNDISRQLSDGEQVCIGSVFAQCVSGSFVTTACAGGTTCAALPLVNKAGTSITCTTTSDAQTRNAATGATGGLTGDGSSTSGSASTASSDSAPATAASSAPATNNAAAGSSASSSSFLLSNGQDAQKLNAQFASLSASSSCTEGENACVNGGFAQCSGGKFVITQCAGGTTCAALPLVNKAGTSIACTTTADAEARIAATGAQGGLTGSS